MNFENIKSVYFIGAGGIGMSALERFFMAHGRKVAGYDRTPTPLTEELSQEGADIHFEDNVERIPSEMKLKESTLVVYTPAIPATHSEMQYFRANGFRMMKRAEVLGVISREKRSLCVAGTHGKTTTSAMTAHLLHQSKVKCNAFLGGISKNFGTNYLLASQSPYVVVEADEYDRSFHQLRPYASVITSADADHLDIYGTEEAYLESFSHYTSLIQERGALIIHASLGIKERQPQGVRRYEYSRNEGDMHAENVRIGRGHIVFDYVSPLGNIQDVELGVPVSINIENAIAAMALAQIAGVEGEEIRRGMASYSGVDRRFDFRLKTDKHVLLSDYAHHPEEIRQSIRSIREVFEGRKITVIFQPHLYTRTRDFYEEFAQALSLADEVWLTEIYPARELPIEGVTSQLIYKHLAENVTKHLIQKEDIPHMAQSEETDVLMVLGAGDVEDYMSNLTEIISQK